MESRKSPVAVQLSLAVLCKKKGRFTLPGVAVRAGPRNWALIGPARPQCTKEAAMERVMERVTQYDDADQATDFFSVKTHIRHLLPPASDHAGAWAEVLGRASGSVGVQAERSA